VTTAAGEPAVRADDLCQAFARTVARYGDADALRSSDGRVRLSWREFDRAMRAAAGGLAELGVGPGGTVAMLLRNRYEAAVIDLATLHLGAVPLSVYNSSPVGQLRYLFADSRADVVVTEQAMAERAAAAIGQGGPKLVVVDGPGPDFEALCSSGSPLPPGVRPAPRPDDLITVVYTSGTTGEPKGAELTHYNILEQIRGLHSLGRLPEGGRALSYLPFAHMGDRLCAYYMPIVSGATITYHPDPRTAADLLPSIRPTLYMAVPRIWERLRNRAVALIDASAEPSRSGLLEAVRLGEQLHDARVAGEPSDQSVRRRWQSHQPELTELRVALGVDAGELLFTGAAPLPPATLRFFAAIGTDLCECYGQSETAGIILCNPADRPRPRTNGLPLPGVRARLAPDGELLLRGPMVMAGYRGKPELTKAAFDAEGWLRTGDIFDTDQCGYYRIVDRKRDIFVTSTGKNIAPVHVENTLAAASPLIGTSVCFGDGRPYLTALIVPEPDAAAALTGQPEPARAATDPTLVEALRTAVRTANASLSGPERVRRFGIVAEPWLPGGAELTPTMKVKRAPIAALHADVIETLYGPPSDAVVEVPPVAEEESRAVLRE
jgi:long-subunit acyl-CoA synthetase (AMP-forming)